MSEIAVVTSERHGNRRWNPTGNYAWLRQDLLVSVSLQEAVQLMMMFPLGFTFYENRYELVILMGLRAGENLWVGDDGRWLAMLKPALLKHYPFKLVRTEEGQDLLAVHEDALVPEELDAGTPLYDHDGNLSFDVRDIVEEMARSSIENRRTWEAITKLQEHELFEPWPIQVQDGGNNASLGGLFRIREQRLHELSAESLLTLQKSNALLLANIQLLSMQHLQNLGRMANAREAAQQRLAQMELNTLDDSGLISFNNL